MTTLFIAATLVLMRITESFIADCKSIFLKNIMQKIQKSSIARLSASRDVIASDFYHFTSGQRPQNFSKIFVQRVRPMRFWSLLGVYPFNSSPPPPSPPSPHYKCLMSENERFLTFGATHAARYYACSVLRIVRCGTSSKLVWTHVCFMMRNQITIK